MITLDSPIATLIADQTRKRTKVVDGLGLRTVGDLLRHFPRRYLKTGELTTVGELHEGQLLTVVGEISHSETEELPRPAHRSDGLPPGGGAAHRRAEPADVVLRAEAAHRRLPRGAGSRSATKGVFTGQVSTFRDQWQLTNPKMLMLRRRAPSRTPRRASSRRASAGCSRSTR